MEMTERTAQKYFVEYSHIIKGDAVFPGSHLPVLLYKNVLDFPLFFDAAYLVNLFEKNHWRNSWKSGIYTYHHYHSTAHEVIAVYKGKTTLLLGGDKGESITVERGDVVIIPAGVAHKNMGSEHDVSCVGAYANGIKADLLTGKEGERLLAEISIGLVPLPDRDPVLGLKGGTEKYWRS